VVDLVQQPQLVPVRTRVGGEVEEVASAQQRLIALALGQLLVGAVALQRALRQVLAAGALGEAAGVVVVFQVRLGLALVRRFQLQARLLEVVVAAGDAAGAGGQAQGEALDHWIIGHQAGVLLVGGGRHLGETGLVIAKHQHMALRAVLEVVMDAFFLAQALDEVQVGLVVLHAVVARRIGGAELEALAGTFEDAVFAQHLGDDLRHRQVLEDALVDAMPEPGQLRAQGQVVAGQALAGITLGAGVHLGMDAAAVGVQGEEGRLAEQGFEVQVRALADQGDLEHEGLAERLVSGEFEHLQVVFDTGQVQAEMRLVGGGEHPLFLLPKGHRPGVLADGVARVPASRGIVRDAPRRCRDAGGKKCPSPQPSPLNGRGSSGRSPSVARLRPRSANASRRSRRCRTLRGSR